jgi:hypothetical protein
MSKNDGNSENVIGVALKEATRGISARIFEAV